MNDHRETAKNIILRGMHMNYEERVDAIADALRNAYVAGAKAGERVNEPSPFESGWPK